MTEHVDSSVRTHAPALERSAWPAWHCPTHDTPLGEHEGRLECPGGHAFSVVQGIPRFVPSGAYASAFGAQWKRHRLTQLDSHSRLTVTRDRTRRAIGEPLWERLATCEVLECGCGAGRFTEVLLDRAARVTSIDLSDAVEANAENFPIGAHHRVAQADITALPFAPSQYDVVLCLGVVQHTPSPERTIAKLFEQVRPGGWLVIDHYDFALSWYTRLAPLFRAALKRLPPDRGTRATERLVRTLLPLHRRASRSRLLYTLLARVSPVTAYYLDLPSLTEQQQRDWAMLDTHDALTDWYKHFRSPARIRDTLAQLGATDVSVWREGPMVIARARRAQ